MCRVLGTSIEFCLHVVSTMPWVLFSPKAVGMCHSFCYTGSASIFAELQVQKPDQTVTGLFCNICLEELWNKEVPEAGEGLSRRRACCWLYWPTTAHARASHKPLQVPQLGNIAERASRCSVIAGIPAIGLLAEICGWSTAAATNWLIVIMAWWRLDFW